MTRKSFAIGKSDPNSQPIEFDLTGTDLQGNPAGPFVFTCVAEAQGDYLLEVIDASEVSSTLGAVQCVEYIRQCLIDEAEVERFNETLKRKDLVIQIELLAEIFRWLVGEYASRPISAPSPSQVGLSPTAAMSTGADGGLADLTRPVFPSGNSLMQPTS